MTCSEWKSVLEIARQKLIDAKEAEATKKVADKPTKWPPENHGPNEVKLVNRKYFLSRRFKSSNKQSQQLIGGAFIPILLSTILASYLYV